MPHKFVPDQPKPGACICRNELLDVKDVVEYIKLQEASVHSMDAEPSLITVRMPSAAP